MVDDDDVGRLGAATGPLQEAGAFPHVAAGRGETGLVLGAQTAPGRLLVRRQVELGAVAGLGAGEPEQEAGHELRLRRREGRRPPLARPAQEAEVVPPALELGHPQVLAQAARTPVLQGPPNDGDVLPQELLLEADGVGGDEDAGAVEQGEAGRGQQVGQRLAHPRARLDDEVLGAAEGLGHGAGHGRLLRPPFEAGQDLRAPGQPFQQRLHLVGGHRSPFAEGAQGGARLPSAGDLRHPQR